MFKNPYAKVRPITTSKLAQFASGGTQSTVASLNDDIATHNAAVDTWESDYATATNGGADPATAATIAANLSATRLTLAAEAVTLVNSIIALRVTIRGEYAAAPAETQRAVSACGLPCIDEGTADNDELSTVKTGLAQAMAAAIG